MIGASRFTAASPVSMPTFSAPKISTSAKNFSLTSALIGAVYQLGRPWARESAWAATATSDLPEPVGVARRTWAPPASASTASSCEAYRQKPRSPDQSRKTSNAPSAPAAQAPIRRSVRVIAPKCPPPRRPPQAGPQTLGRLHGQGHEDPQRAQCPVPSGNRARATIRNLTRPADVPCRVVRSSARRMAPLVEAAAEGRTRRIGGPLQECQKSDAGSAEGLGH